MSIILLLFQLMLHCGVFWIYYSHLLDAYAVQSAAFLGYGEHAKTRSNVEFALKVPPLSPIVGCQQKLQFFGDCQVDHISVNIVTVIGCRGRGEHHRVSSPHLLVAGDNGLKHAPIYYPHPSIHKWFSSLVSVQSQHLPIPVGRRFNCAVSVVTTELVPRLEFPQIQDPSSLSSQWNDATQLMNQ